MKSPAVLYRPAASYTPWERRPPVRARAGLSGIRSKALERDAPDLAPVRTATDLSEVHVRALTRARDSLASPR